MNIRRFSFLAALIVIATAGSKTGFGQATPSVNPLPSHDVKMNVSSGRHYHVGENAQVVWSEKIQVDNANWLRLQFKTLALAGNPTGGSSSTLRIRSVQDGAVQLLNAESARQWRNTSAYFNGNAVELELIAVPNGRLNMVTLGSVTVGEPNGNDFSGTICDDVDDRVLSKDVRVGRSIPNGCTLWLFNDRNNCMMTAGHCASGTDVASFNVPLSDSNGNHVFPGPEDQYAVDFDSMQLVNGGVGNDWCYFGCFPNSNTGLTAFQTQQDSFQLAEPQQVQSGDMIRITGHGSTSFPVDPTWNGAQKTQVGMYFEFTNMELRYRTDTTGGNSGSPVIFESTGNAIGIHTHGGCGSGGSGSNIGTGLLNPGLMNALANPQGVCRTAIEFSFPSGLPEFVAPAGGTVVPVAIDDSDADVMPGSGILNVEIADEFVQFPMSDLGNNDLEAVFPPTECGKIVNYYFSISSLQGEIFTSPTSAPNEVFSAISTTEMGTLAFDDDFETDMNWGVTGNASTGQWERGIPIGGGDRGDPPTDADGSGACYLTQNDDGDSDVDNGSTTLTSPTMDATAGANQQAILSYYRWYDNDGSTDSFLVEISDNNGSTWTTLETIDSGDADSAGGWNLKIFEIAEFADPTDQMRLRFTAADTGSPSIVEAGVDGIAVQLIDCDDEVLLGDVNLDGIVTLLDVPPFVELLSKGGFQLEADLNQDGLVDLADVSIFVDLLSG